MAEIPRSLLDEYTAQFNSLSEASQQLMLNALANAEWDTIAQLRSIMEAVMDQICLDATDTARVLAADMYNDVRQVALGKRLGGYLPGLAYDPDRIYGSVRACIQSVVKTGDTKQFGQKLADRIDYEIKNSAAVCSAALAKRDPLKPKWARVPTGRETCTKCIMLASRGFVYRSSEAALHYHQNCDCRVVQGYEGVGVEGYDPDALYRVWRRLEDAEVVARNLYKGGPVAIQKEADNIDIYLRQKWKEYTIEKHSARRYRDFYGSYVSSFSSGGDITIDDFTKVKGKEVQLASWITRIGQDVHIRNADEELHKSGKTSDFLINETIYEAKRIISSNPTKMATRITEKKRAQGPNFIVDLSCSEMSREVAETKIAWLLEDPEIEEILLIKSKTLKRFKK